MTDNWTATPQLLPEAMTSAVTDAVADAVARTEPQPEPWTQYGTQTWTATLTVSRSFTGPESTHGIPVAPQPAPVALPPHREPLSLPAAPSTTQVTGRVAPAQYEPAAFDPADVEPGPFAPRPSAAAPYQASPYGSSQYQPPRYESPVAPPQYASPRGAAPTRPAARAPLPPVDTWTHDRDPVVIPDPWDLAAERAAQVALREEAPRVDADPAWSTSSDLVRRPSRAPAPRGANGPAAAEAHARALTVVARPERAAERAVYRDPAPTFHKTSTPLLLRMVLTLAILLCCVMAGVRAHVGGLDSPDNSTVAAHLPAFLGGAAAP